MALPAGAPQHSCNAGFARRKQSETENTPWRAWPADRWSAKKADPTPLGPQKRTLHPLVRQSGPNDSRRRSAGSAGGDRKGYQMGKGRRCESYDPLTRSDYAARRRDTNAHLGKGRDQ